MGKKKIKTLNYDDILAPTIKVDIGVKSSEPSCTYCLPSSTIRGHQVLNGILIHTRIDCPEDTMYLLNEDQFEDNKKAVV